MVCGLPCGVWNRARDSVDCVSRCITPTGREKAIDFVARPIDDGIASSSQPTARERSYVGDTKREESSGHGGYAFGPFVVDPVKRRLWREGRLVPITSKTFDVLVVLLEHRDHIVSKDELLNRVWPNTAVNENNLARQISSLRRALGQRPDQHDFVVTVPGHGYRFVASVQDLPDAHRSCGPGRDRRTRRRAARACDRASTLPRAGEEPLPDQPIPGVSADDADPGASTRPNGRWTLLGTLVAASCATPCDSHRRGAAARPADLEPEPRRTLQRITYDEAALPRDAAWAPDGQWVVYASDRAGNADLWKQRPGDPDPVRLTTSEANESQPQWSPDGQSIVFRSERDGGGLYVIPASGGVERDRLQLRLRAARGHRTGRSFSSSVRWCFLICPPSTLWAWMESRRVPSGPTCSVNSARFMPPGILMAGAFPSGARSAKTSVTIPDRATRCRQRHHTGDIGAGPAGPRERLGREVRLGAIASAHLFRGASGRYAERLARDRRSSDGKMG